MPKPAKRGRPKSKDKMEQITIKLPPIIIEELRKLSKTGHNPMSYYIRQAIVEHLQNLKKK